MGVSPMNHAQDARATLKLNATTIRATDRRRQAGSMGVGDNRSCLHRAWGFARRWKAGRAAMANVFVTLSTNCWSANSVLLIQISILMIDLINSCYFAGVAVKVPIY